DVEGMLRAAEACCEELGMPGVFLCKYLGAGALPSPSSRLLRLDYVDLGLALERAAMLVHHGGIGTTAQALRAGIPQIIVPRGFDQPDNGRRVEQLGVGRALDRQTLSGPVLAAAARALLADGACKTAVTSLQPRIERSDA